jgi:hypothetical protein
MQQQRPLLRKNVQQSEDVLHANDVDYPRLFTFLGTISHAANSGPCSSVAKRRMDSNCGVFDVQSSLFLVISICQLSVSPRERKSPSSSRPCGHIAEALDRTLNESEVSDTRPRDSLTSSSSQPSPNHAPVIASEHLEGSERRQRRESLQDRRNNGTTLPEAKPDEPFLEDDFRYDDQMDDAPQIPDVLESRSIESVTIEPDLIQRLFNM